MPQVIGGGRGDRHDTAGTADGWRSELDQLVPTSAGDAVIERLTPPGAGDPVIRDRLSRVIHGELDGELAALAADARGLRGRIADLVARSTVSAGTTARYGYQARQIEVEARRTEAAARALVLRLGEWTRARDRGAR